MNQSSNVGTSSPIPVTGAIDPRIKDELDCLNSTSDLINRLENQIREKHNLYRTALSDSTQQLNYFSKTLGDCVGKARPYHEAKRKAKEALHDTQSAAGNFERSVSMHNAAREMVNVAEQGMLTVTNHLESAWPEMLNQATLKVNEAETGKNNSEIEHLRCAEVFKNCEREVTKLGRKFKSSINKSRPYFNVKEQSQKRLQELSESVRKLDIELSNTKLKYAQALRSLEGISNSIHEARKIENLGVRGSGVGAEMKVLHSELANEQQVDVGTTSLLQEDEIVCETEPQINGNTGTIKQVEKTESSEVSSSLHGSNTSEKYDGETPKINVENIEDKLQNNNHEVKPLENKEGTKSKALVITY